jgi:copper(I)-binding protein
MLYGRHMRFILAASLVALALAACNSGAQEPRVSVEGAMVHLPAVKGRPGAAYFSLKTNNDPTRLLSVTSPAIERIELHDSVTTNGVSRMGPAQDLTFSDTLAFEAGGKHAMLFGLDPALKPGAKIALTFNFQPAPPVTVEATVHGPGGGHSGH